MFNKIEIVRGTTNTIAIDVLDANGAPYALKDGEKLIFGVKRKVTDKDELIVRIASAADDGSYVVKIEPIDTVNLPCDKYVFDVGLQSGDAFYNVIESSPFVICGNVTKWGCAD